MIELIEGDCLEVLPTLASGSVDAVITDPPYGCHYIQGKTTYSGTRKWQSRHHHKPIAGDSDAFDPSPFLGFPVVVLFGANHYASRLPDSRGWIFWDKRPSMRANDFGDGELIWTNQDRVIRRFSHTWNGVLRASENGKEHYHPAQKPVALLEWLIKQFTNEGDTILDPFAGSGTTAVAAYKTGRNCIAIEKDAEYFNVMQRRVSDVQMQPALELTA